MIIGDCRRGTLLENGPVCSFYTYELVDEYAGIIAKYLKIGLKYTNYLRKTYVFTKKGKRAKCF